MRSHYWSQLNIQALNVMFCTPMVFIEVASHDSLVYFP